MSRLLRRSGRRYLLRHPWQLGLSVLGVALGVAVVVAIDLANASAERAFTLSMETVSGRATHEIVGGPAGVPDTLYRRLRVDVGLEAIAPVIEGSVSVEGDARSLRVLGIDPFAEAPFRSRFEAPLQGGGDALPAFLVEGGTAFIALATAERLGLDAEDDLIVRVGTRTDTLRILGTLGGRDAGDQEALGDLLLLDVATAQELFSLRGRLSRIDLLAPGGAGRGEWLDRVAAELPPGVSLRSAEGRTETMASMTRAFSLNLTALGLLALLVGMFLVYNAMSFAVVQRRTAIGTLRAIGVTRREIAASVLGEAAILGVVGTVLGIGLGIALGSGLVRLVAQTINDLYFAVTVSRLDLAPGSFAKGALLGVGVTLIAALVPALEAAGSAPRQALGRSVLEERWRRGAPVAAGVGGLLAGAGTAILALSAESLLGSFVGIFVLVMGMAAVAPAVTVLLMSGVRPAARALVGVLGAMAARGVVSALSRTGVAVSALMIAVSVTVGVGVMVDSFRGTVEEWLQGALVADVYVSAPDFTVGSAGGSIPPDLVATLAGVPGARASSTVRRVELPTEDGSSTRLVVVDAPDEARPRYPLVDGDFAGLWPAFRDGDGVLVSEPFARRTGIGAGDDLPLPTDRGVRSWPVLGVYYDYSTERGIVAMHRTAYRSAWDDADISGVAFLLEDGVDIGAFMDSLASAAGPGRALVIQSNRAVREGAIEVFDRTFTITTVLRSLVVVVAFVGILSALTALQLERAREFGVLRANGMTPRQARGLVVLQTGFMGLAAGLLSIPVGLVLAWVMVHVINVRAFGWTLVMDVDPALLVQAMLVAVGAALAAGLYPAWRLGRTSPALALREE